MTTEERLDNAPAPPSPGACLRAAREAAGLSLAQVAAQLKLAARQVKALEEEDFAQLPGRTFTRGFVRNYARLLNLDGEDLLSRLPDAARAFETPALQPTAAMIAELPTSRAAPPAYTRWVIPILLVASIVAAAAYEWYDGGLEAQVDARRTVPTAAAASAPAATTRTELPNPLAAEAKADATATLPAARAVGAEVAKAPLAAAAAEIPAPAAATAALAPLQLRYRGSSWTEIRDRNGVVLISRLVDAGAEQSIHGSGPFDIVIGNANEVTLLYRGAPVDLSRYTRQNVARLHLT